MVNLKIDWKVPKAACLVKLKRDKDKSVDFLSVGTCDIFEAVGREGTHNKFLPCCASEATGKDDEGGWGCSKRRIFNI